VRIETTLRPAAPYSLADSVEGRAGGTRMVRGGVLDLWDLAAGAPVRVRLAQRPDGTLAALATWEDPEVGPEAVHDRLRFLLALDVDPAPFLRIAREDPRLRELARRRPGIRPLRLAGGAAHALLAAACGQLVAWKDAARVHAAVLRASTAERDGLRLPPTQADLAALSPARARAAGLAARRAAALVRVCRGPALERLATRPREQMVRAIARERDFGPWSAGVVAIYGLGRYDHGLVGDLGLMRLLAAERGAVPAPEETAELLAPYGEWAGLASVYLLRLPPARRVGPLAAVAAAARAP
jgi:DNA-3-methyladenine glycosylase II